ncbi:MAG: AI-2E family transporter [Burkholderiaceae bacterium]
MSSDPKPGDHTARATADGAGAAPELWGGVRHLKIMIAALLFLAVCAALYVARPLLIPLVFAALAWLALGPMVRWLLKFGIPAALSALALTGALVMTLLTVGYMALGPISEWMQDMPSISARLQWKLRELRGPMEAVTSAAKSVEEVSGGLNGGAQQTVVVKEGGGLIGALTSNLQWVLSTAAAFIVLTYFLLASGTYFHARLIASFDHMHDKKKALRTALEIERDVSHYLGTITAINVSLGIVIGSVLFMAGMPSPWLWGITAAVLNYMPYIGPLLGVVLVAVAAVISFDGIGQWLLMPGLYFLCTGMEGQFITPWLLGRRLNLTPVAILLSVAFWAWIWGFAGAVIAVPMLVVAKAICVHTGVLAWFPRFVSVEQPPADFAD